MSFAAIANTLESIGFIFARNSPVSETTKKESARSTDRDERSVYAGNAIEPARRGKIRECEIAKGVWGSFTHLGVGGPVLKARDPSDW